MTQLKRSSTFVTSLAVGRSTARHPTWGPTFVGTQENGHSCAAGLSAANDSRVQMNSSATRGRTQVHEALHRLCSSEWFKLQNAFVKAPFPRFWCIISPILSFFLFFRWEKVHVHRVPQTLHAQRSPLKAHQDPFEQEGSNRQQQQHHSRRRLPCSRNRSRHRGCVSQRAAHHRHHGNLICREHSAVSQQRDQHDAGGPSPDERQQLLRMAEEQEDGLDGRCTQTLGVKKGTSQLQNLKPSKASDRRGGHTCNTKRYSIWKARQEYDLPVAFKGQRWMSWIIIRHVFMKFLFPLKGNGTTLKFVPQQT